MFQTAEIDVRARDEGLEDTEVVGQNVSSVHSSIEFTQF